MRKSYQQAAWVPVTVLPYLILRAGLWDYLHFTSTSKERQVYFGQVPTP